MSDKKYLSRCYTVTALSNMHVGSGDESLGLVDNRVQRDVVTNLPCINASGLKGSLREYFTNEWGKENKEITYIFGSESNSKKEEEHKAGAFNFFSGNLLSMPVRSNRRPHYFATSPEILKELLSFAEHIGHKLPEGFVKAAETAIGLEIKEKTALVFDGSQEGQLEDFDITIQKGSLDEGSLKTLEDLLGSPLALCGQETMKLFCDDFHLPLIARNNLENGRSKNLWHEQVVPRQSRFYFFTLEPTGISDEKKLKFEIGKPVQIGGNASIGYGFCAIKELVPEESAG